MRAGLLGFWAYERSVISYQVSWLTSVGLLVIRLSRLIRLRRFPVGIRFIKFTVILVNRFSSLF